jgi:hypothetical protein
MTPEDYAVSDKEFELTKKRKMWIKLKITSFLGTKRALFRGGTPFPIRVALQLQLLLLLLRPLTDEIHGGTPTLIRGITPLQSFVILQLKSVLVLRLQSLLLIKLQSAQFYISSQIQYDSA